MVLTPNSSKGRVLTLEEQDLQRWKKAFGISVHKGQNKADAGDICRSSIARALMGRAPLLWNKESGIANIAQAPFVSRCGHSESGSGTFSLSLLQEPESWWLQMSQL